MNRTLMEAVAAGDLVRTRSCLRSEALTRADLDQALSTAVKADRADLVNLLLDAGADPNDPPPGRTWGALHLAVEYERPALVALLVSLGADVNRRDRNGWTPLMLAVDLAIDAAQQRRTERSTGMVETLLRLGADPGIRDATGRSPEDVASADGFSACVALLRRPAGR